MKFTPEVIAALETLKNAAENDFERHRINVLENDLSNPPRVEIIDETHQKFCGIKFRKSSDKKHFIGNISLHRLVYEVYFGKIPEGCEIHHRDFNPANNNIENLQMLTKTEHSLIHFESRTGRFARTKIICEYCGKEAVVRYQGQGRNRFCSEKCKTAARRIECKEERTCAYCGKKFLIQNYEKVRYCSVSCAQKDRQKEQHIVKKCPTCGKEFESFKGRTQKYCSPECAHIFLASGGREIKVCKNCGKEFSVAKSRRAVYCSRKCYFEARNKHS